MQTSPAVRADVGNAGSLAGAAQGVASRGFASVTFVGFGAEQPVFRAEAADQIAQQRLDHFGHAKDAEQQAEREGCAVGYRGRTEGAQPDLGR